MADTPKPTHYYVRLAKGSSFRAPFGVTLRSGQALTVPADDPHLGYWRSSSRFRVTESISVPRGRRARVPVRRAKQESKKEPEGLAAFTRKQLVQAARDLGLTPRSSDNKDRLVKMIEEANAAKAAKAVRDKAAADASQPPDQE